jgi:hypothetical protein
MTMCHQTATDFAHPIAVAAPPHSIQSARGGEVFLTSTFQRGLAECIVGREDYTNLAKPSASQYSIKTFEV